MKYLKYIKYLILLPIFVSATYLIGVLIITSSSKPAIVKVKELNIKEEINKNIKVKKLESTPSAEEPKEITNSFSYKLTGYLYGPTDSSIILRKGSKEYLLRIGDKIESYELININDKEVIFSLQGNLYKITNNVGKNK